MTEFDMNDNDIMVKFIKKIGKSLSQVTTTSYRFLGPQSDMLAVKKPNNSVISRSTPQ